MNNSRVFYLVPDYNFPSWGIGMLYSLALMSVEMGMQAFILREDCNNLPPWLDVDIPILDFTKAIESLHAHDVLVVPEVMAGSERLQECIARKMVYVQNGFLISEALAPYSTYQEAGFERAMVVMRHIGDILDSFWPIKTSIVSPFVADYFFNDESPLPFAERKKQILLFPKPGYQQAGYMDYQIVLKLLQQRLQHGSGKLWTIIELESMKHQKVAALMKESIFFINTNCFESLNATVAEAMASGCINFCYEAYGGRDFLRSGENAFVFPNNYVYPLLDKLFSYLPEISNIPYQLELMQMNAIKTANEFRREKTKKELKTFYNDIGVL